MKIPDHLGGHLNVTHIDEGSIRFLKSNFGIKSALDVGCGPGWMERICEKENISWVGIDGDPSCKSDNVIIYDFTSPVKLEIDKFDLVWSVEFVEHVDEQYVDNVIHVLTKAKKAICMTHALPGKRGYHHVNCKPAKYWIEKIESVGFIYDEDSTNKVRKFSTMRREFMRNNGLVFIPNS